MLVFLELNGYEMEYTQKELSDLILDVGMSMGNKMLDYIYYKIGNVNKWLI